MSARGRPRSKSPGRTGGAGGAGGGVRRPRSRSRSRPRSAGRIFPTEFGDFIEITDTKLKNELGNIEGLYIPSWSRRMFDPTSFTHPDTIRLLAYAENTQIEKIKDMKNKSNLSEPIKMYILELYLQLGEYHTFNKLSRKWNLIPTNDKYNLREAQFRQQVDDYITKHYPKRKLSVGEKNHIYEVVQSHSHDGPLNTRKLKELMGSKIYVPSYII